MRRVWCAWRRDRPDDQDEDGCHGPHAIFGDEPWGLSVMAACWFVLSRGGRGSGVQTRVRAVSWRRQGRGGCLLLTKRTGQESKLFGLVERGCSGAAIPFSEAIGEWFRHQSLTKQPGTRNR